MQADHIHTFAEVEGLLCEVGDCEKPADWICSRCCHATCKACRKKQEGRCANAA